MEQETRWQTGFSFSTPTQVLPAGGDQILINIGGGSMALLDPQVAGAAVSLAFAAD